MNVCLDILTEQVEIMKENFFGLFGGCANMLEFSNYSISKGRKSRDYMRCKRLNNRIKKLYDDMESICEDIRNL
ncbi:hypothetical protein J6P92_01745 [bacterium]|nr:hypothetical protein [bacterium]